MKVGGGGVGRGTTIKCREMICFGTFMVYGMVILGPLRGDGPRTNDGRGARHSGEGSRVYVIAALGHQVVVTVGVGEGRVVSG
jgi:hypothetical protein